jgi:tripartite ATP-independent transporter DctP family solute receptor
MKFSYARTAGAITIASGLALTGACSVGASDSASGEGESQVLLLGHGADPGNPRTIAADAFAEQLSEETDGRITVQVQGSEQLGDDSEMLQSVKAGTLDLTANSQGPMAGFVPEVALIGLPFLFDDSQEAYDVIDGEVGDELAALAEKQGFKVLAWWDNGIRHITNGKRPIETPEDLAGLKIRTPEDPMTVDIFSTLNANPTPLDFGELYLALRQGTVDGQENPLTNIASAKLYEVQDHLALSGHKVEVTPFVMNLDTWNALSPEDQEVVQQAAEDARDQQRQLMEEQNAELEDTLAQDMKITEPDKDAFREATKGVYDKWAQKYPELVEQLNQAAGS